MNKKPRLNLLKNEDAATPAETVDHTRRHLVRGALAAGALAGLPLAGCGSDDDDAPQVAVAFSHGVASGDPLSDRVILWTRVLAQDSADTRDVPLRWEVSTDANFTAIAASGTATARAASDFCVKVDATGLLANTRYWYRFKAYAATSAAGRTKTLPTGSVSQVKLAVFSCSNYPTGYFNVYAEAAKRAEADGYDVAVHLGDYIYEYGPGQYASDNATALNRVVDPQKEILALADYRRRYAQYRSDADLQKLHALVPMIAVWDDHEVANDTWKNGAQNHQPATEGEFAARKAAAVQAWHEWLPVRDGTNPLTIYRSFNFGSLMALHMLDTRVLARDEQLDYADYITATGLDAAKFQADMARADRTLMGATQGQWLQAQMQASTATWQVLGQQVLMGRMNIPAPILFEANAPGTGVSVSQYAAIVAKAQSNPAGLTAQERAVLAAPSIPYNLDAWDGYPVARETLLGTARQLDKNLVVLAGDTHNAWANDLLDASGNQVGVEFATSSVTSPGFEDYLPKENPQQLAGALTQLIGPLVYADTSRRGYLTVTATPTECRCDWIFVSTILSRDYTATVAQSLRTLPGAGQRKLVGV
ncbi:alkaline phosphatase D family protein [Mitsuaria sp. GD03876]|uniref:alkaline phosphatase D family protein n=1 Tax=Mitsuaria sp. GD03876 TaxID=2975399 RepID=UPI0024489763|nr:alkaline phosphatase D family protein [Mitsuaria sp. GD03876]MDH0863575.1 alkaline phosphatase D family protein [Mitsuaria sp. GD03876]